MCLLLLFRLGGMVKFEIFWLYCVVYLVNPRVLWQVFKVTSCG